MDIGCWSPFSQADCPCSNTRGIPAPSFIGNDYYCESGNAQSTFGIGSGLVTSDLLWDGQNCEGQCCSNWKNPPWFKRTLPVSTEDYIEIRICADQRAVDDEDVPVALIELYVQWSMHLTVTVSIVHDVCSQLFSRTVSLARSVT